MMTNMTLKQILVLLHVIHSFIPEECILETEFLKPTFNKQGGLEKLVEQIPVSAEELDQVAKDQQFLASLPVFEVPMDIAFNLASSQLTQQQQEPGAPTFQRRPVDVAEILLAPVCVTYSVEGSNQAEKTEKMVCFWVVILKTRKCYNFNEHLRWMINELDNEDRSHVKKAANREYEDIMNLMREVVLHQYEKNPDATCFIREQGSTFRMDPFQRMTELDTPDTLDSVCSVYGAYRTMAFHASMTGITAFLRHTLLPRSRRCTSCVRRSSLSLCQGCPGRFQTLDVC